MLKPLEKLGGVAGFIPIVSSVAGVIKYFYYKKAKNKGVDKSAINETAQKINTVKGELNVEAQKDKCYEKLRKASLVEMIPGVNIFAAIYSAGVLSKLSDIRDINKDPVNQRNYLFKKYNVKSARHDWMNEALIIVDNLNLQDVKGPIEHIGKFTTRQATYFLADDAKRALSNMLQGYDLNPGMKNADAKKLVQDGLNYLIDGYKDKIGNLEEMNDKLVADLIYLARDDLRQRKETLRALGANEGSDDGKLSATAEFRQKNLLTQQAQIEAKIKSYEIHKNALETALNTLKES